MSTFRPVHQSVDDSLGTAYAGPHGVRRCAKGAARLSPRALRHTCPRDRIRQCRSQQSGSPRDGPPPHRPRPPLSARFGDRDQTPCRGHKARCRKREHFDVELSTVQISISCRLEVEWPPRLAHRSASPRHRRLQYDRSACPRRQYPVRQASGQMLHSLLLARVPAAERQGLQRPFGALDSAHCPDLLMSTKRPHKGLRSNQGLPCSCVVQFRSLRREPVIVQGGSQHRTQFRFASAPRRREFSRAFAEAGRRAA